MASLSDGHLQEVHASAIAPEIIEARGYQSITNPRALPELFASHQRKRPGLLIPIRDVTGAVVTYQLKPDDPRLDASTGKPIKYETAANGRTCIDVPPAVLPILRDTRKPLWITEGCKKVDSGLSNGIPCIVGLSGVWNWLSDKTRLPDWDEIPLKGRSVVIAFDSDAMVSHKVRAALERFGRWLAEIQQAEVHYLVMPQLPDGGKCGLDDWFANGSTRLELDNLVTDTLPGSVMDWDDPIPLDPTIGPPFPEVLPGTIGQYVAAVAESYQVPVDLPALVALGTLSAAVGGKYTVVPAPDWEEPVHIMTMPVLKSGERKSGVMKEITRPVRDYETDCRLADREARALWEERRQQKEAKLKALRSQAVKLEIEAAQALPEGRTAARDRIVKINSTAARIDDLVKDLNLDRPPVITQVIADNVTPESAQRILHEQGGKLAIISPESAFLTNIAGRYSNSNPDLDVFLKGHAADPIRNNRVTRDEDDIPRACLTLCISPQPSVVARMGTVDGWIEQGGAARLLPAFPVSNIGYRNLRPESISDHLREAWAHLVHRALKLTQRPTTSKNGKPGDPAPHALALDTDALPAWRQFREWRERESRPGGQFAAAGLDSWANKLEGAVLRIAGLLHIAEHEIPQDAPISATCLQAALTLGHYFHRHAVIMYAMSGKSGYGLARSILEVLCTIEGDSLTRRDLYEMVKGRVAIDSVADLAPILETLEEHGWIRQHAEPRDVPGRRPVTIRLHPDLRAHYTGKHSAGTPQGSSANITNLFSATDSSESGTPLQPTGTDGGRGGRVEV